MQGASSIGPLLTATATINSSGENTAITAVAGFFICVYRYKLRTASTTAVTVTVKDAASGNVIDTDILQAPTSGVFGTNEGVEPPGSLFQSARSGALIINLSGAISVTYSISYFLTRNPQ